jgi:hypothetical protein
MTYKSSLRDIYDAGEFLSIKYDSYFPIYEELLAKYVNKSITLVEVGIFNGGSLFMWREFLGPGARIIGIDLNPDAKEWEKHGFEIYIGDQGDENFWKHIFRKIGPVDVLIDDGGHTNLQQIMTTHYAIQNIRDGGVIIVEDVHTNYLREFGNPFKFSFLNFTFKIIDGINSRAFALRYKYAKYSSRVYRVSFYESIIVFDINTQLCIRSQPTSNGGQSLDVSDFRYQSLLQSVLSGFKRRLSTGAESGGLFARVLISMTNQLLSFIARMEAAKYRRYFNGNE